MHSCGVVIGGQASLLSGRSGVGKSTLAMQLVGRGAALLGDNWVGVHAGQAWSFHTPVNVHDYNVARNIYDRMPLGHRLDMWGKAFLRRLSLGYLKKSTPIVLRDLFPEIVAEHAPLRHVLTFSQGPRFAMRPLTPPRRHSAAGGQRHDGPGGLLPVYAGLCGGFPRRPGRRPLEPP